MIQIRSAASPFNSPGLYQHALAAIQRADAMGLLPRGEVIERLDVKTIRRVLGRIAKAGICRSFYQDPADSSVWDPRRLEKLLVQLNDALETSPAPSYEWARLAEIFGIDQLARLLGISPTSVRRYRSNARTIPDHVAARLHFLALVVGDLAGAYNEIGIRRWFERKRTLLENRSPAELLTGEWNPNDPGPARVRDLAHSLVGAAAT